MKLQWTIAARLTLLSMLVAPAQAAPFVGGLPPNCAAPVVLTVGTHTGLQLVNATNPSTGLTELDLDLYAVTVPPATRLSARFVPTNVTPGAVWNYYWGLSDYFLGTCGGNGGEFLPFNEITDVNRSAVAKNIVLSIQAFEFNHLPMSVTYDLIIQLTPDVTAYSFCPGATNSTGLGGTLTTMGTASLSANDLTLVASSLPYPSFAIFASGTAASHVTLGDGSLCLAGAIGRYHLAPTGSGGSWSAPHALGNLTYYPQPGNRVYLQVFYRDNGGPLGTGFNLTNALSVTLLP